VLMFERYCLNLYFVYYIFYRMIRLNYMMFELNYLNLYFISGFHRMIRLFTFGSIQIMLRDDFEAQKSIWQIISDKHSEEENKIFSSKHSWISILLTISKKDQVCVWVCVCVCDEIKWFFFWETMQWWKKWILSHFESE
jgi:hypothetical protein